MLNLLFYAGLTVIVSVRGYKLFKQVRFNRAFGSTSCLNVRWLVRIASQADSLTSWLLLMNRALSIAQHK